MTFKTVEVSQDVDFNKVKVKIKTPSGGEIVKSVKEFNKMERKLPQVLLWATIMD